MNRVFFLLGCVLSIVVLESSVLGCPCKNKKSPRPGSPFIQELNMTDYLAGCGCGGGGGNQTQEIPPDNDK